MENFFGILKQEMYYGTTYYSFEELKDAIERYIKYYNEKRIKAVSYTHLDVYKRQVSIEKIFSSFTDATLSFDVPVYSGQIPPTVTMDELLQQSFHECSC